MWSNLAMTGHLSEGETLLVHGGTGGIGTHAIQVGKALGAHVLATAGSPERLQTCLDLGADLAIDYHDDLPTEVASATDDRGVDVILDNMGASGLKANLRLARHRRPPRDHRADGRAEDGDQPRDAAHQAPQRRRDQPARPRRRGPRRQGRDRRGGARRPVAAGRAGPRSARWCTSTCRSPRRRGPTRRSTRAASSASCPGRARRGRGAGRLTTSRSERDAPASHAASASTDTAPRAARASEAGEALTSVSISARVL